MEASPKKGRADWDNYLMRTLQYPAEARRLKETGTVLLKVKLDKTGIIQQISVLNPEQIHHSLAKEAIRVTKEYPNRWNPQTENGQPVPSEVRLPFRFLLETNVR
ncbi:energy transducer TonB [Algoriphagus hitonicola]|uniref:TonB family C-terminal domain-containing protein n=1 Tax=Algoriphagus hitonicola TaxID=435880 RepID=A0A1I2TTJ1_9BACT|nr:energy transducer TonB [Algoriphagus hitonicola]SFG66707.1 TonB family C-terminal domain-containing protein [Algoriphagus hitonicola]